MNLKKIFSRESFSGFISKLGGEILAALLILIFMSVGVAGYSLIPKTMQKLTPLVLWVLGFIVIFTSYRWMAEDGGMRRRFLYWIIGISILTFLIEAAATATGWIFGDYNYGIVLGLSLFNVPLVIGFNWVIIILGTVRMFDRLPAISAIFLTGVLCTLFDVILEPVAIRLGFWAWEIGRVPLQNYAAWFLIAAAAAFAYRCSRIRVYSKLSTYCVIIEVLFFIALRIVPIPVNSANIPGLFFYG